MIVETTEFELRVSKLLGPNEQSALRLLLADDPARGVPVEDLPGLLRLDYAGCIVYYAVAPTLLKVYLLDIEKDGASPPPSKEDAQILRKVLSIAGKGTIIVVAKKGLKWLWEFVKDEMPPMP